jgi:hypothetical protein
VHRNTQGTLLFTAGQLGAVDDLFDVSGLVRQELAVNVRGLRCADYANQKKAGKRQRPQPGGMRGGFSSAMEAFCHVTMRIAARATGVPIG